MSYLVLARKWRPLKFSDLVGQEHIARTIERAIKSNRVSHAFLFTGTRGVGKTTTARILSMALNCEKGPTADPCGVCSSCREIKGGVGLDVMEIDGASNNSVEDIRNLREQIAYTPAGGKHRIVIIDEVHMLSKSAFNALLKSLEEPPPNFIFIFATTEINKVPETILSRVQQYVFKRISPVDIKGRLKYICDEEKLEYEDSALFFLAEKAKGSMRDALTLLDQVIPFCADKITQSAVKSVLGLADADLYFKLFECLRLKDEAAIADLVASVFAQGIDIAEFAAGLEEHVRNLLLCRISGLDENAIGLSIEDKARYAGQSAQFNPTDLLRMTEIFSALSQKLSRSEVPRFDLEIALLKLSRMDSALDIASLLRGDVNESKKKLQPDHAHYQPSVKPPTADLKQIPQAVPSPSSPKPSQEDAIPEVQSASINYLTFKNDWKKVIKQITVDNITMGTHLSFSFVLSAAPEEIKLGLPENHKFDYQQLIKPESIRALNDYFKLNLNYSGRISIESVAEEKSRKHLSPDSPVFVKKDIISGMAKKESINEAIKKEPIIGTILDVFEGEVI